MTVSQSLISLTLLLALAGCTTPAATGTTPSPSPSPAASPAAADPDKDACEHFGEATTAVTATAAASGAPVLKTHTHYILTPPASGDSVVQFQSAQAADYHLYFDPAVTVQAILDAQGTAVTPKETKTASATCARVKTRVSFAAGVGPYTLTLRGVTSPVAMLIIGGTEK